MPSCLLVIDVSAVDVPQEVEEPSVKEEAPVVEIRPAAGDQGGLAPTPDWELSIERGSQSDYCWSAPGRGGSGPDGWAGRAGEQVADTKPRMRICFDPEHEIPKLQARPRTALKEN